MHDHDLIKKVRAMQGADKVSFINQALIKYPSSRRLKLLLAKALNSEGKPDLALDILDAILKERPENIRALLQKANILAKKNQPKQAYEIFSLINKLDPSNQWAYVGKEKLIYQEGDIDEAINILSIGIKETKNDCVLIYRKADLYIRTGNYEPAMELLRELESSVSYEPRNNYLLAKIYQGKGEFYKAKQELEVVETRSKDDNDNIWISNAKALRARIAFLEYDYIKATKLFKEITLGSVGTIAARDRLSLLYVLKGKVAEGISELKTATKEIENNKTKGKINIPLIGHSSKVINEITINPQLQKETQKSFSLEGQERIDFLARLQIENPSYFGAALYLINELRSQGTFHTFFKNNLRQNVLLKTIPKTIIQYWNEASLPKAIAQTMQSWKKLNPEYEHKIYSRKTAFFYIKYRYGMNTARAFQSCIHPAMQADFFRLAYLNSEGGFYADADDRAAKPLDNLRATRPSLIMKLGDFGCISNNFLGAVPNNEILKYTFEKGLENVKSYYNEGPWFKLGPGHLTTCISYCLSPYLLGHKKNIPSFLVLDQSEYRKYVYQHLSLPYKSSDKSWYNAEYKRVIK